MSIDDTVICPRCGAKVDEQEAVCGACGCQTADHPLQEESSSDVLKTHCQHCGKPNDEGCDCDVGEDYTCIKCGMTATDCECDNPALVETEDAPEMDLDKVDDQDDIDDSN